SDRSRAAAGAGVAVRGPADHLAARQPRVTGAGRGCAHGAPRARLDRASFDGRRTVRERRAGRPPTEPGGMTMDDPGLFDLTGRIAVVTGAGGGLGTAICAGLAAYGADVALLDVDGEALRESAAGVERAGRRALALETDASIEEAVEGAFEEIDRTFGKVDILVNLAFIPLFAAPHELSVGDWEKALRINLTSYFLCVKQAAQRMIAQGKGGAIMNMCS